MTLISDHGLMIIIALLCFYECCILTVEYWYDKTIEESKKKKRKVTKGKVRVVIDKEGNVRIAESPKELDVQIDHEGC